MYNNRETTEYDGGFIDPLNGLNVPVDTIAVFLNNYFATIGSRLYNLNDVILDDLEDLYPEMHGLSFVFPTVDRLDILMLRKSMYISLAVFLKYVVIYVNVFFKLFQIK